jgi:type I restriction enzyme S subunit
VSQQDWHEVVVKDVCESVIDCVNKTAPVVDYVTPYRMIRTTNVKNGVIDTNTVRYVEKETFEKWTRRDVPQVGDVILTREAPLGDVGMLTKLGEHIFLGQRLMQYRTDQEKLDNYFLLYALQESYMQGQLKAAGSGSTVEHIRVGDAENLKIRIPDIQTQRKWSSMLRAYDNLIENNNRRIAILEEMVQSLYREWFVKFRFPGHENVKFIDSPLGRIPEGWDVVALEDICERITDGAHKSPKSVDDGVPMASVKDMHDFGFNLSKCRHISEDDYLELVRQDSVVRGGDVLIAKDGSYLKHTFVVEKDMKVALLSSIAMLRPNERVKAHWLSYCLRSDGVKDRMKQCVSGVAIPRIILKDFRKFKVTLPHNDIQESWNGHIKEVVNMCWMLIRKNNNLRKQKDMVLPKLISGTVTLQG